MTQWITDRQPTKADEDKGGEVRMMRFPDGSESSIGMTDALVAAAHVGPGVPWKRTDMWEPPATPEPQPEAPQPEPKPKLRVGQVWRSRCGEEVGLATFNGHKPYPFNGSNGVDYTDNGSYWLSKEEHPCDLVELITDTPAEAPAEAPQSQPEPEAPKPEPKPEPELRVGQVWRSRCGKCVAIDREDGRSDHPYLGSNKERYTPGGRLRLLGEHPWDLVELITDTPAEAPQPQPEPAPATRKVPRLFAGPIRRIFMPSGSMLMDAIADDGTAWFLREGEAPAPSWRQIPPLPDREEQIDA